MLPSLVVETDFRTASRSMLDAAIRNKGWDRELTRLAIHETEVEAGQPPIRAYEVFQPLVELTACTGRI